LATQKGGAEFYPSCQQIKVGGDGTGTPSEDELLSFPGSYSDDDPGIYTPNVFNSNAEYVFPGGPIAKLVESSGGDDNDGTGNPGDDDSSTCSLKNNKQSSTKNRRSDNTRPHRVSRIMGKMLHGTTW